MRDAGPRPEIGWIGMCVAAALDPARRETEGRRDEVAGSNQHRWPPVTKIAGRGWSHLLQDMPAAVVNRTVISVATAWRPKSRQNTKSGEEPGRE